jgi:hypothetical protein
VAIASFRALDGRDGRLGPRVLGQSSSVGQHKFKQSCDFIFSTFGDGPEMTNEELTVFSCMVAQF